MFDPGPYSRRSPNAVQIIGKKAFDLVTFRVKPWRGGRRARDGAFVRNVEPPFMPEKIGDVFHPGGNSVCYALQWASLMGCKPVYLLGFTLAAGGGYEGGALNPVTRKPGFWRLDHCIPWLEWVEKTRPGWVRLFPGWDGPIYDVFRIEEGADAEQDEEAGEFHADVCLERGAQARDEEVS